MRTTITLAAAFGLLAAPALAQQSPTGQSSGGPARDANPGMSDTASRAAPTKRMSKKSMKRTGHKHRAAPKQSNM